MKISYIHANPLQSGKANEIFVAKMSAALCKIGHSVELILPKDKSPSDIEPNWLRTIYGVHQPVSVRWVPRPVMRRGFSFSAALFLKVRKTDFVLTRHVRSMQMALFFGLDAILELHAPPREFPSRIRSNIQDIATHPKTKGVVVITHALADWYRREIPDLCDKLTVLPSGADRCPENTDLRNVASPGKLMKIGYVGNFYKGKGMEVVGDLVPRCPWAFFHIVGGPHEMKRVWENELKDISNVEIESHATHVQAQERIASMDVCLIPNQKRVVVDGQDIGKWTSPMKMFEYMAHGKAILCSDLPVLKEILIHDKNALFCSPTDVSSWVAALERLRDTPGLSERLGCSARQDFERLYTWDRRAQRLCNEVILEFPDP